jgi:hypothetical protein
MLYKFIDLFVIVKNVGRSSKKEEIGKNRVENFFSK